MADLIFGGGLNEQGSTEIDSQECIEGYNFELSEIDTHFRSRNPFEKQGTAPSVSGGNTINGFIQLIKQDDTKTTLVQAGTGIFEWDGNSTFTSKGNLTTTSKLRGTTWSLGGYSVITDLLKTTVVQKWDGTSFGTLTTGLGGDLFAKYGLVYQNRVWLFNVKSGTDTPHLIVASAFEDPESYNITSRAVQGSFATGLEAFYIVAPNLRPINGVAIWYDTLIISTEGGIIYKLTGSDANDYAFKSFYTGSAATGVETMSATGNDVVYIRKGGVIESLGATDKYGDTSTDDLSLWIRNQTRNITDAITVYDQKRQKIYFFIGSKILVLFKNKIGSGFSPWSVYTTQHSSQFTTNVATYMRDPFTSEDKDYVYFGDTSGNIYFLDSENVSGDDNTTDIVTYRKSLYLESDQIRDIGISGRVYYHRISNTNLSMGFEFGDDFTTQPCDVPLKGPPVTDTGAYYGGEFYFGGDIYFNAGFQFTDLIATKGYSPSGKGTGIHLSLTVNSRQNFDVIKITDQP